LHEKRHGEYTIGGNYYNALSATTLPVYGSVDKKTRLAAWMIGDRKDSGWSSPPRRSDRGE
jgi:hypothetical protein